MKSLAIKAVAGLLLVLVLFLAIFLIVRNPSFFDQRGVFGPIEEEAWRFEEDVGELTEKAKILFGGDLMFDRHIRFFAEEKNCRSVLKLGNRGERSCPAERKTAEHTPT